MSDVQWLFVVLAALYGWECTGWLRWGAIALTSWSGRRWTLRHPGALAGNQRGGLVLAPPFPPLGTLLVAGQYPLSLAPEGVLAFAATYPHPGPRIARSGSFVRWADVREVKAHGRKLRIDGEIFLTAASAGVARQLRQDLQRLAQKTAADRAQSIRDILKRTFDTQAAAARLADFRQHSRPVRWLANLLLVYVFTGVPTAIWHFGFLRTWLGLLLGLLALTITTATLFCRAHRKLYPDAEDERFTHTLTIALAPSSAMRAPDPLARPLLENFHPLAAAHGLLDDDAFRDFARQVLRDVRHPALPTCPGNANAAAATEQFFRAALRQTLEDFLKTHRLDPDELCRAPEPTEAASRAYCPRCETQFATAEARCADCGGMPLVPFTKP